MSQHDLTIDNQGFPAFRADLNNALQALGSTQSGTSAPSPTFANQLWYDTTNNQLKIRNEDNDAWITLLTLDQSGDVVSQLAATIAVLSAGTAGAPALTTSGDTNTGIFFPAADTIAFAEGGVEAMRIDSSGNVGIGTSSVGSQKLHIRAVSPSEPMVRAISVTPTANGVYGQYNAKYDGTANDWYFGQGSTGAWSFWNNDGSVSERMRIDSSGRVTMPSQPAFAAYKNSSMGTSNAVVTGFTANLNRGNHFNASTGTFTAPVAGAYVFSFSCIGTSTSAGNDTFGQINGNNASSWFGVRPASANSTDIFAPQPSISCVVNLAANDTFRIYSGNDLYSDGNNWIKFSGYLIG